MLWLAVASAFVPGVSATTFAVIASHTLTTSSSSGSACSRCSSAAFSAVVVTATKVTSRDGDRAPRHSAGEGVAALGEQPVQGVLDGLADLVGQVEHGHRVVGLGADVGGRDRGA